MPAAARARLSLLCFTSLSKVPPSSISTFQAQRYSLRASPRHPPFTHKLARGPTSFSQFCVVVRGDGSLCSSPHWTLHCFLISHSSAPLGTPEHCARGLGTALGMQHSADETRTLQRGWTLDCGHSGLPSVRDGPKNDLPLHGPPAAFLILVPPLGVSVLALATQLPGTLS